MPSCEKIVKYWISRGEPFEITSLDEPECFGCGRRTSRWGNLDRAHLIERSYGGLDHEANLAMLCGECHRRQPTFTHGQIDQALAYAANTTKHLMDYILDRLGAV